MDWKSATTKGGDAISIPKRWLHLHYYEALNILFRMENALRVFVYVILKNELQEKWAETTIHISEGEQSTIAALANRRIAQAKGFGYLGYEISSPLMHLNSGELTRLITSDAYWTLFQPYFKGKKEIIRTKLDEVGTVRNSLAHFRPIKYDDIELIKQNVKHAFVGIEECLAEMTQTYNVVPTNSEDEWYKAMITLDTDLCALQLYQSKREKWVRVEVSYSCPILTKQQYGEQYISYGILNVVSPAVVKHFHKLACLCTYMTEYVPHATMGSDFNPSFRKQVSIVFSREVVKTQFRVIQSELQNVLLKIQGESELVQKDNLARGALVESVYALAVLRKGEGDRSYWWVDSSGLKCSFEEEHPPEYWGDIGLSRSDFIAGSNKYPWMPSDISSVEVPF